MLDRVHTPLEVGADVQKKTAHYQEVLQDIRHVLDAEDDWCAAMATVSSLLHHAFDYYHWTGFYRTVGIHEPKASAAAPQQAAASVTAPAAVQGEPQQHLVVGPYQGRMGCLRIPFSRGVCGAAASTRTTQLVPDVHAFPGHIACASSTLSEVVAPVLAADGMCVAVLDIDSNLPAAFDSTDQQHLEELCSWLSAKFFC